MGKRINQKKIGNILIAKIKAQHNKISDAAKAVLVRGGFIALNNWVSARQKTLSTQLTQDSLRN